MTDYKAMAKEIDATSEADLRLAEGEVVTAKKSRARREDVLSVRLSPAELQEIMSAAEAQGRRVSDFVREASLVAARDRKQNDRWLAAPVADALDQLVARIEEQRGTSRRPSRAGRR